MRRGGQDVLVWTCYPQKHRVSCLKVFSAAFTHTRELLHFFTWVGTCSLVLCWFPLFPCCWVFAGREAWVVDSSPLSLFVTPSASALSANMTPVDLRRLACAHKQSFWLLGSTYVANFWGSLLGQRRQFAVVCHSSFEDCDFGNFGHYWLGPNLRKNNVWDHKSGHGIHRQWIFLTKWHVDGSATSAHLA
jgi:hypothetical protein